MALTLRDVVVRYGDVRAVDRVSLDLEQGRVLAVLGPSGLRQVDAAAGGGRVWSR